MKKLLIFFASFLNLLLFSQFSKADSATENYKVTARKLDKSKNKLSPKTGTSSYSFDREDINNLSGGSTTPLNKVLLQAPGVTQDSFGQIHVRGDHSHLQYRINDIIIPEGISGFGQVLDTHFADKITLITGALPAQYGFRTGGVVDIKTKSGDFEKGNRSEFTTGSYSTIGANQQFSGSVEKLSYHLNASYLQNNLGIESPTSSSKSIHNFTRQDKEFGYFSYLINAQSKLSLILGNSVNRFEIPNNPNQRQNFTLSGTSNFSSSDLDDNQKESNRYAIAALQGIINSNLDYQIALFTKSSKLSYKPDYQGNMIFNGVASSIERESQSNGLQSDFSYSLNDSNILRSGFFISSEANKSKRNTSVFAVDAGGNQTSSTSFNIPDGDKKTSTLYAAYLQNEWKALSNLTLNYGLRFDAFESYLDSNQFSPRLGVVYELSKDTKIYAGYAKYFTPPEMELISTTKLREFENTTNAPNNLVNDEVRPERTNYYNIGATHKLTENLNLGIDGYYKIIRNVLDKGQFGSALIYTPFNYEKGKVYGAEFSVDYHKDKLSTYLNLSLQQAKAKGINSGQYLFESDEINFISRNYVHMDHDQMFNASAGISYLFLGTNYSADAIYGSGLRKGFANTERLAPYLQVNLGLNRDFTLPAIEKFNLRFSIINAFDKIYQIRDGSGIGVGAPQYGPRRAYYMTVVKSF